MSKFAILKKDDNYKENMLYSIFYYGGDKAINTRNDEKGGNFNSDISEDYYHGALLELSKKGYVPQCEYEGTLIFKKSGLFN